MLRRWLIYGIWGAAAVALTGVGLWRASVAPPTRVEMRKVYRGDVVVNAGWDWSILLSGGNVLWPAGTVLPGAPAARAYPLAGKPILRAVPKVEVRGPSEQNLVVSVSAQAVLRVMNGDMEVWQKQLNGLGVTVRGSPAAYTGPALAVDMAGARTEMERINTALGLLDRYQGEVTFGLRAEVSGDAAGNVSVAAPVVLQPDTFNPPPSDKWRGQVRVPLVRQEQVEVRVPLWQRAAEEWPFFGGTAAALAVPALVVGRRRLAEASKEHHRYRRWITRGRLSDLDVRTVMVEDLRSLVRIAHDIGRRVIHDPNVGYGVPDGLVCYVYRPQQAPRIGELLVAQGVVAEADIAAARQQQVVWRRPLGECLVAMGLVDEVAVHAALAYQQQRVFLEPGRGTKKLFMPRMLLPIAVLGERPDHTLALAVPDPSIPRDIVEAAVGRPVWLAVCREKALASAGAAVVSGSGEMTARGVGRLGAQLLREHGLTLGLLLYVCGLVSTEDALEADDHRLYRRLLQREGMDLDLLQLAVVVVSSLRKGNEVPDLVTLLHQAQRIYDRSLVAGMNEEQLVVWRYVTAATVARARLLLSAAGLCLGEIRAARL